MSIVTVSNAAQLQKSLASAHGGDTILLQPGTYSGLSMNGLNFATPVTITSADSANQAVLTNFNIGISSGVSGLTFSHLDFKVLTPNWSGFNVYSSQNITFDHDHIYGPAGAPDPNVQALNFFDSQGITLTNNEVEQVAHGLTVSRSSDIVVSGNNIHNVNADTLDFVQVSNLRVTGNALHDFYPTAGNHPDAMQFATSNSTTSSHDITISDNLIYRGAGANTQGIFMGDELGNKPFLNVTISNNIVIGTGSSGIRPTHVSGLTMTGNHVVTLAGGDPTTVLVQTSDHVTSSDNTSSSFSLTAANGNTNITETHDIGNAAAATDAGASLIQQWMATHSVGPQGVSPPPAPVSPPPPVVNHAPAGADSTQALAWHATKVFASSDFGFSDIDGNHLSAVKLDALPSVGALTDNGVTVTAGQLVSVLDISAGKLVYQAPLSAAAAHVDLTFQVQDDGGVANGGVNLDPSANTLHFDVAAQPVSPPPAPISPPPPPVSPPGPAGQIFIATAGHTQITGGAGDDTLASTVSNDYLHGGAGDDVINGGVGFDDIGGDAGADTAHGNGGDDWVDGGAGDDLLFGDAGNDLLWGNLGADTLNGGDGDDQLHGGQGNDSLSGGAGNDFIIGDLGNDTETGGAGADVFHANADGSVDRVLDFHVSEGDRVQIDNGTHYIVRQAGADTVVDFGHAGEMILVGVQMSTLTPGWIFGA